MPKDEKLIHDGIQIMYGWLAGWNMAPSVRCHSLLDNYFEGDKAGYKTDNLGIFYDS